MKRTLLIILIAILSIVELHSAKIPQDQCEILNVQYLDARSCRVEYKPGSGYGRILVLSNANADWNNASAELDFLNNNPPFNLFKDFQGKFDPRNPLLNSQFPNINLYVVANLSKAANYIDIIGLDPQTHYEMCMYEYDYDLNYPNIQYNINWSQGGSPQNWTKYSHPYNAPNLLGAGNITGSQADISWFDGASFATKGYNIYLSEQSSFPNGIYASTSPGMSNNVLNITNLKPSTRYYYAVEGILSKMPQVIMRSTTGYFTTTSPTPQLTPAGPIQICNGSAVNITISNVTVGLTYQWYKDGSILTGQTNSSYIALESGIYTVISKDASGTQQTSNAVNVRISTVPTINDTTYILCSGHSIDLYAVSPYSVNMFNSIYTANWYDAAQGGTLLNSGLVYNVSPSSATTYYVELSEISVPAPFSVPCKSARRAIVTVNTINSPEKPAVNDVPLNVVRTCFGVPALLVPFHPDPATHTFRYYDQNIGGNLLYSGVNFSVSLPEGDHYIYVESVNAQGCSSIDRTEVLVSVINLLPIAIVDTLRLCGGNVGNLTPSYPDTSIYNFMWYDVPTGGVPIFIGKSYEIATTGNITYYVATTGDGCISPTRTPACAIIAPIPGRVQVAPLPSVQCAGSVFNIQPLYPDTAYHMFRYYNQSVGGMKLFEGKNYIVSPNESQTYYVEAVSNQGCISGSRTPITVNVSDAPANVVINTVKACNLVPIDISPISPDPNSYTFNWYEDTTQTLVGQGPKLSITPSEDKVYYVEAVDGQGCVSLQRTAFQVVVLQTPDTVSSEEYDICQGGYGIALKPLYPDPEYNNYRWYDTPTGGQLLYEGREFTVNPTSGTTYYVEAFNDCGLQSRKRSSIVVNVSLPPADPQIGNIDVCKGNVKYFTPIYPDTVNHWFILYSTLTGDTVVSMGKTLSVKVYDNKVYYLETVNATGCKSNNKIPVNINVTCVIDNPIINDTTITLNDTLNITPIYPDTVNYSFNWYKKQDDTSAFYSGKTLTMSPIVNEKYYVETISSQGYSPSRTGFLVKVLGSTPPPPILSLNEVYAFGEQAKVKAIYPDISAYDIKWYNEPSCSNIIGSGVFTQVSVPSTVYAKSYDRISQVYSEYSYLDIPHYPIYPAPQLVVYPDCNKKTMKIQIIVPPGSSYKYYARYKECGRNWVTRGWIEDYWLTKGLLPAPWAYYEITVYLSDGVTKVTTLTYDCCK